MSTVTVRAKREIPTEVLYDGEIVAFDLAIEKDVRAFRAVMESQISLLNLEVAEKEKIAAEAVEKMNNAQRTVSMLICIIGVLSILTIMFFMS